MNKQKRKALSGAIQLIEQAKHTIDRVNDQEQTALDNLPEAMSERQGDFEDNVSDMEDAIQSLDDAIESISAVISR